MTDFSRPAFDLIREHYTVPNAIDHYRRTFEALCEAGVRPRAITTDLQQSIYQHQRPLVPRLIFRIDRADLLDTALEPATDTCQFVRYNHLPSSPRAPAPLDALLAEGQWMDLNGGLLIVTEAMLTGEQLDALRDQLEAWAEAGDHSPRVLNDLRDLANVGGREPAMRYPTADNAVANAPPNAPLPLPDTPTYAAMFADISYHLTVIPTPTGRAPDNVLSLPLYALTHQAATLTRGDNRLPNSVRAKLPAEVHHHERPHAGSKPGLVAYFDSPRKAWLNQPTETRIGRYLRRHLKDAHDEDIKQMAAEFTSRGTIEVKLAETEDDFREVYLKGPQSCMKYGEDTFTKCYDEFGEWRHPVEAYVHPESEIRLAYTLGGDGRIGARALINQRNRTFPRLYGSDHSPRHKDVLEKWLIDNDYVHDDDGLQDEPMQVITLSNGGILCPYIDDANQGVRLDPGDNETMYIGGRHEICHSDGYFLPHGGACDHCDRSVPADELTSIHASSDEVCDHCLDGDDYVRAVNSYGDAVWARRYDVWHAPSSVSTNCGANVDYVTDDHSDDELDSLDLALVGSTLYHRDETLERGDRNERVLRDSVLSPDDDNPLHERYAEIDDEAWPLGECFFHEDEGEWRLLSELDLDTMVQGDAPHIFREKTDDELDISRSAA